MLSTEIARVCHEANRAYCLTIGDGSQYSWADAPQWQVDSAVKGVEFCLANPDAPPSANHDSWYKQKEADGWVYGEAKNAEKKTHPCMVPYEKLPAEQQKKDALFKAIVAALRIIIAPLLLLIGTQAQAGQVNLPTSLDHLIVPGTYAVVQPFTFSDFSYFTGPPGTPPNAAGVTVSEFHVLPFDGIRFDGAFMGAPGQVVDYVISYLITAPVGALINSAELDGTFDLHGGTGSAGITELLSDASTGNAIASLSVTNSLPFAAAFNFQGTNSIYVQKDILLYGTAGASVTAVDQGFRLVPEPSSFGLLAIGISVLAWVRRGWRVA
jgi:hypothetical protein